MLGIPFLTNQVNCAGTMAVVRHFEINSTCLDYQHILCIY